MTDSKLDFAALPDVFPGYLLVHLLCARCGHDWTQARPVGAVGVTCPNCERYEAGFNWVLDEPAEFYHDGAWLTGKYALPEWNLVLDADPPAASKLTAWQTLLCGLLVTRNLWRALWRREL